MFGSRIRRYSPLIISFIAILEGIGQNYQEFYRAAGNAKIPQAKILSMTPS